MGKEVTAGRLRVVGSPPPRPTRVPVVSSSGRDSTSWLAFARHGRLELSAFYGGGEQPKMLYLRCRNGTSHTSCHSSRTNLPGRQQGKPSHLGDVQNHVAKLQGQNGTWQRAWCLPVIMEQGEGRDEDQEMNTHEGGRNGMSPACHLQQALQQPKSRSTNKHMQGLLEIYETSRHTCHNVQIKFSVATNLGVFTKSKCVQHNNSLPPQHVYHAAAAVKACSQWCLLPVAQCRQRGHRQPHHLYNRCTQTSPLYQPHGNKMATPYTGRKTSHLQNCPNGRPPGRWHGGKMGSER